MHQLILTSVGTLWPLFRIGREDVRIVRVYTKGHDHNLPAWEEEVADWLQDVCELYGDAGDCQLVGEAKWVYLRFTKSDRAVITDAPSKGSEPVTMQRVHRNNTPRRRK